jgi:hypothetical protein
MSDSRRKRWDQNARRFEQEIARREAKKAVTVKVSGDVQEQRRLANLLQASRDANPADSQKETKR